MLVILTIGASSVQQDFDCEHATRQTLIKLQRSLKSV